ncbi:MAG: aminoacyl-tRNA deacylase [Hyphomicrobiaceae bacterium]
MSHVPTDNMAKAVVLSSRAGYLLAVIPASRRVNIDNVGRVIDQPVALATEEELAPLFPDCEPGAIPPIGSAYGLRTVVEDTLEMNDDIYFEAGDHRTLVHITGKDFCRLMRTVSHGRICLPASEDDDGVAYFGA